jgi:hypothetical protein
MASVITETELLDALAQAVVGNGPADARTSAEIRQATGLSEKRVVGALHVLANQGRLQVHRVARRALDGRTIVVPAYTITPAPSTRGTAAKRRRKA